MSLNPFQCRKLREVDFASAPWLSPRGQERHTVHRAPSTKPGARCLVYLALHRLPEAYTCRSECLASSRRLRGTINGQESISL